MAHKGISPVAKAVKKEVESQKIFEPWYDRCQPKNVGQCDLATGIEGLFVAEIASRLHEQIEAYDKTCAFNRCIYMPSTVIEKNCGFDLSVGHFERRPRIRLMHKLIREWCDSPWEWTSKSEYDNKTGIYRCVAHIANLVDQFRKSDGQIRPFISFTVCYCLHEHRRMGQNRIPAFENRRRSLFVDLGPLAEFIPQKTVEKTRIGQLHISHKLERKRSVFEASWRRKGGAKKSLRVLNWSAFLKVALQSLKAQR